MANFRTKYTSAKRNISHLVGMLINKIVVFGVLRILKQLNRGIYIQKKSLFGTLIGLKV